MLALIQIPIARLINVREGLTMGKPVRPAETVFAIRIISPTLILAPIITAAVVILLLALSVDALAATKLVIVACLQPALASRIAAA